MVCVLLLTEYECIKSLRGQNKETMECLEMGLGWRAGNIKDFNVSHWWGTIGMLGRIALPLRKFILAAEGRTRGRKVAALRGTWEVMVAVIPQEGGWAGPRRCEWGWRQHRGPFELWLDRTCWSSGYCWSKGIEERENVKDDSQVSCLYLGIECWLISTLYQIAF